jgi:hypothetical protein
MYTFNLESGLTIDTALFPPNTGTTFNHTFTDAVVGTFHAYNASGHAIVYSSTQLKVATQVEGGSSGASIIWGSAGYSFADSAALSMAIRAELPILNWIP